MKCKYTVENIESFMSSIFNSDEKKAFMNHLEDCPKCKAYYTILNGTESVLKAPVRLEKDISERVMKVIDKDMYKRKRYFYQLKGLFYKYPALIKGISSIAAVLILTMLIAFNFNQLAVSLGNLKDTITDRINSTKKIDNTITEQDTKKNIPATIEPIEDADIIELHLSTAVIKETSGKQGPSKTARDIVKLQYGQIIQIRGFTDSDDGRWYLASLVPTVNQDGTVPNEQNQKFYVSFEVLEWLTKETAYFDDVFYPGVVAEYRYIVRKQDEEGVLLKQLPDADAKGAALVHHGNLLAVVRKEGEWSLVKKMNASSMVEVSRVGWIKNSDYSDYSPVMSSIRPNQGFLVRPFDMYSKPGVLADIPARVIKNLITPVNILKWEGEWIYVSSGFNGVAFYVKSDNLRFTLDSGEISKLINPEPDPAEILAGLKEDILNWKNLRLEALDYPGQYSLDLNQAQKQALASKLTKISDIEKFDGGILPSREAAYPFYTLEFLDDSGKITLPKGSSGYTESRYENAMYAGYSLVVAGEDRLLVSFSTRQEHYGMTQFAVPIRFIKVNKEFVSYLKTLMPVPENKDKTSFHYLLNAVKVNIISMKSEFKEEGTAPQQVWKTARRIMDFIDFDAKPVKLEQQSTKTDILYQMKFTFPDGSVSTVEIGEAYMIYDGNIYRYNSKISEKGEPPENIAGGLFVAYF